MISITQTVEVLDHDGNAVLPLCVSIDFPPESLHMSEDRLRVLLSGSKTAKVRREITETIGGPGYSSVRVSTAIEVLCDQSDNAVRSAAEAVYQECVYLNEDGVLKAYEGLLLHRDSLKLPG